MSLGLRDYLARYVPSWLGESPDGPSYGFRFLSTMGLLVDLGVEQAIEGSAAGLARGTPTALAYLGQERGLLRWQDESDLEYAARLRGWIDANKERGSERSLAKQIRGYLRSKPKVEIINRAGGLVAVAADGTVTTGTVAWNWDGTSNPERAGFWSDIWVIVYTNQFTSVAPWGSGRAWGSGVGLGSSNKPEEFDAIASLCATWKSAHVRVRSLIVNRNNTRPVPNGSWGLWHTTATGFTSVASSRDLVNNFYWDFG